MIGGIMYQEFKRKLLNEMEIKRDIIVMEASTTSIESIFEICGPDDKMYSRILATFNNIVMRHVEDLIVNLCIKYNIFVEKTDRTGLFDLMMSMHGRMCYVELKTFPKIFNEYTYRGFLNRVKKCGKEVYLVYLLKDSQKSRNEIERERLRMQKFQENDSNLNILLFEDFLLGQFGVEELNLFKKAMSTYRHEMHEMVGYQITEIFNDRNLYQLKSELDSDIYNYQYDRIKKEIYEKLYSKDVTFKDIYMDTYKKIKNRYLEGRRYKILLGENDFAKSFLTSEWIYKKYFSLPEMDNTFIVTGYLKSIEQLLWDIIYIVGQGRKIRNVTIERDNSDEIDTTLGSLEHFITNYSNDDLFEKFFGPSTHFVMRYLKTQLSVWRLNYRNGYFHKSNLQDKKKIDIIRDETFFLFLLILGTISLDEHAERILNG